MNESIINTEQLRLLVKERNEYKILLDECLRAFNLLPNRRIQGDLNTYKLAFRIENSFRRFT